MRATVEQPGPGLPRPRMDGRPVPWITQVSAEGVEWKRIHSERIWRCQTQWLCQVCGEELPDRAWVVVCDWEVVSDAAMHLPCQTMAFRFCPFLAADQDVVAMEVSREQISVSGDSLASFDGPGRCFDYKRYGGQQRMWTVFHI